MQSRSLLSKPYIVQGSGERSRCLHREKKSRIKEIRSKKVLWISKTIKIKKRGEKRELNLKRWTDCWTNLEKTLGRETS